MMKPTFSRKTDITYTIIKFALRVAIAAIAIFAILSFIVLDIDFQGGTYVISICYFLFLFTAIFPAVFIPNASPLSFVRKKSPPEGTGYLKSYLFLTFAVWLIFLEVILILISLGFGSTSARWAHLVAICTVIYAPAPFWIIHKIFQKKLGIITLYIDKESLVITSAIVREIKSYNIASIHYQNGLLMPEISIVSNDHRNSPGIESSGFTAFLPMGTSTLLHFLRTYFVDASIEKAQ